MLKLRWLFKRFHSSIWLGLLTLWLVTAIFPAMAHIPSVGAVESEIHQQAFDLLEQGRSFYQAGQFNQAIALWQQALKPLQNQGDSLQVALTYSYLSNAYQELGEWEAAESAIAQSLNLLQTHRDAATLAQVLNTQGSLQLAMGKTEAALETWKQAEKAYTSTGDRLGKLGSLINQAQALQVLGLYRQAQIRLEQLNTELQTLPDSSVKVSGLRSLGVALQVVGDLTQSQTVLEQSLAIAQRLNLSAEANASLFSLANTLKALELPTAALENYQKVAENATNPMVRLQAQLNQLSLLVETQQPTAAQVLLAQIQPQFEKIAPSRMGIYSQINLAQTLIEWQPSFYDASEINRLLANAIAQARMLNDRRAASYALGQLGYLAVQAQQWETALPLTQQALAIAQAIDASSISTRWQGQLGYILKQQGDVKNAIAAYTEAVSGLQSLRSDLVAINSDIQFSFRESVEPIYRQLVELLLESNPSQENLKQAREVIEALHLAELDNFFREACLNTTPQQIEQLDPQAAIIYPIILTNRLEVILSLPGKPLHHYTTVISQAETENTLEQLLESFNLFFAPTERFRLSQQVYNWLIQPAETELSASQVKRLVFVLDGGLRNLPMAALYDGQQYLIEKYEIAIAPSLQLLPPRLGTQSLSRSLAQKQTQLFAGGITQSHQGFSALPGVESEVNQIASEVPSQVFLNQEFTAANLEKQLNAGSFPIVHLATHGQFSSRSDSTFILTWNEKINVKEFETILQSRSPGNLNPIELLILSACQTATGDTRAALGLAGVAVRSGARSTIGTLWSVKDVSTAQLMSAFYQELVQGESKAGSLRKAQLTLLKDPQYAHPFYWSPFILVGNWL